MEEVTCNHCGRVYLRFPNKINEAKKFGWKQFCSQNCLSKSRVKQKEFKCGNPNCKNTLTRKPSDFSYSGQYFCSSSCSAKVSNIIVNSRRPKKHCANENCGKEIKRDRKYCSVKCQWINNGVTDEEYREIVLWEIQEFHKGNGRIPLKREMWNMYHSGRRLFETWNKAIIAAGFKPNPVRFANKYRAKDGHRCDSMAEKIIDDWLTDREIKHETKVPYNYHRMSADFKMGDTYIEFFGLKGEIKSYDRLIKEKEKLWQERHLDVVRIYPNDLFPVNKLEYIFGNIE